MCANSANRMLKKATSGVLSRTVSQGWGQILDYGSPRLDPILGSGDFAPSGLAGGLFDHPVVFGHRGRKRLTRTQAGDVVLQLKTPYRDGTTHVVMAPLEFLQRLAALVPRPRLHLIRFHGVLAPNATLRAQIVPSEPHHPTVPTDDHTDESPSWAQSRAQLLKRVFEIDMTVCSECGGPLTIIAAPSAGSGQAS